ncbi:PPC domain-containing DNA-binding protein [Blastococcus sp. SYSU DS1024]
MQYREITTPGAGAGGESTYVVILDEGDDAVAALTSFAQEEQLSAAQVTAVGAFRRAVVGWFDRQTSDYRRVTVGQQCEVLSLIGDVALGTDGQPALHLHAVLGLADATTRGGHLLEGEVWPTLEVVVRESPAHLRKTMRPEIGLALIDLDRAEH